MVMSLSIGIKLSRWCPGVFTITWCWTPKRLWRWWRISEATPLYTPAPQSHQVPPASMALRLVKFLCTTISRDLKWYQNMVSIARINQQRMLFLRHLNKFATLLQIGPVMRTQEAGLGHLKRGSSFSLTFHSRFFPLFSDFILCRFIPHSHTHTRLCAAQLSVAFYPFHHSLRHRILINKTLHRCRYTSLTFPGSGGTDEPILHSNHWVYPHFIYNHLVWILHFTRASH